MHNNEPHDRMTLRLASNVGAIWLQLGRKYAPIWGGTIFALPGPLSCGELVQQRPVIDYTGADTMAAFNINS